MTELETAEAEFARCHAITGHGPAVPNHIAELEAQIIAMGAVVRDLMQCVVKRTAERDQALLRMEAAIATSHGLIDAEVQRRIAEAADIAEVGGLSQSEREMLQRAGFKQIGPDLWSKPKPDQRPAFPANALRHQSQAIGLLCTADGGRVRLGGYAPTL